MTKKRFFHSTLSNFNIKSDSKQGIMESVLSSLPIGVFLNLPNLGKTTTKKLAF